jgi:hypothetical protein
MRNCKRRRFLTANNHIGANSASGLLHRQYLEMITGTNVGYMGTLVNVRQGGLPQEEYGDTYGDTLQKKIY